MHLHKLISFDTGLNVSFTQRFSQFLFDQDWGTTEVMNAITRTDALNTAESFILLVSGLRRKDMEDVGSRLPSIYHTVTSKLVTLTMPVTEDGKGHK